MKQLSNMKQQSGFTLIELVVVIVILGILSATALPKLQNIDEDAQNAVIDGAIAAFKSAAIISYGKNHTPQNFDSINNSNNINAEGVTITGTCANAVFTHTNGQSKTVSISSDICN